MLQLQHFSRAGNNSGVLLLNLFPFTMAKGLAVEVIRRFMNSVLFIQVTFLSATIITLYVEQYSNKLTCYISFVVLCLLEGLQAEEVWEDH